MIIHCERTCIKCGRPTMHRVAVYSRKARCLDCGDIVNISAEEQAQELARSRTMVKPEARI